MPLNRQTGGTPPVANPVRDRDEVTPDRIYMLSPGFSPYMCRKMATRAAEVARSLTPRLSGRGAAGISAYAGDGFFGVKWDMPHVWYQNRGIKPFTMRSLAGKTIPMWVNDWTGEMARANPKAETRFTADGRRQILIFRRVGKIGARKNVPVRDSEGRITRWREVPQSFPGAPGRITHREWKPNRPAGGVGGGRITRRVQPSHVGVRWRHPGLLPREFLEYSVRQVAEENQIEDTGIHATYRRR